MLAATEGSSVKAIRSTPRAFPMNANVIANTQENISNRRAQLRPASTASPDPMSTKPVDCIATGQHPVFKTTPESHVVPLRWTARNLLLIREVLLPIEQMQRTDRSLKIAPPAQRRGGDSPPTGLSQVIGPRPTRVGHGSMNLALVSPERQIHGIAQQTITGSGPTDEVARHLHAREDAVQSRQHQVRDNHPERDQKQQLPACTEAFGKEQVSQPHG